MLCSESQQASHYEKVGTKKAISVLAIQFDFDHDKIDYDHSQAMLGSEAKH